MVYLGYMLMVIMLIGCVIVFTMKTIANSDSEELERLNMDSFEHDKIKMIYEMFESQSIGGKISTIITMGGMAFSDLFVKLISFPFKKKDK